MTDAELTAVLRWQGSALQEGAFFAAADRIEALTAERDDWKKRHFKMREERDAKAIAAKNYADFNHEWRNRVEKAEADNARLRKSCECAMSEIRDYMQEVGVTLPLELAMGWLSSALNTGKEVMPFVPVSDASDAPDIGPGDQAVAGAAEDFETEIIDNWIKRNEPDLMREDRDARSELNREYGNE